MYSVVLISAVQQSDLVIDMHTFFFHFLFLCGLSQDIELPVLHSGTLLLVHSICSSLPPPFQFGCYSFIYTL